LQKSQKSRKKTTKEKIVTLADFRKKND
jgi:hypothetical protein